jgi:hypothetical protein
MLGLTLATAVQRFAKVWRQAGRQSAIPDGAIPEGAVSEAISDGVFSDGGAAHARLSAAARWREWRAMASPRAAERRAEASAGGRRPGPTLTWRRSATAGSADTAPSRWRERQARRRAERGL